MTPIIAEKLNPLPVRLSYIFRAAGWSHDGSKQTVKQHRAREWQLTA
ncbi:MAG: hypothetical protein ACE5HS_04315 [bacterium]